MAIIRISEPLLFDLIKDKLLLPNNVDGLTESMNRESGSCPWEWEVTSHIEGFGEDEFATPIYQRDDEGNIKLLRIEKL